MSATQPGSVDSTRGALGGFVVFGKGVRKALPPALCGKQTPKVPPSPPRQAQLWFSWLAGVCNNWVRASIRAGRAGGAGAGGSEDGAGCEHPPRSRSQTHQRCLRPSRARRAARATQGHLVLWWTTTTTHSQALHFAALQQPLLPPTHGWRCCRVRGDPWVLRQGARKRSAPTEHPQGSAAVAHRCAGGICALLSPKAEGPAGFPGMEQMAQHGKAAQAAPPPSQASPTEGFHPWSWDEFCAIPASVAVRGWSTPARFWGVFPHLDRV